MAVLTTMSVHLFRRYKRKCKRLPGRQRMKRWPSTPMPISDQLWLEGVPPGHPFGGVQRGTRRAGSQSVLTQLGQGRRKLCAQRRFARGFLGRGRRRPRPLYRGFAGGGRPAASADAFVPPNKERGRSRPCPRGPRAAAAAARSTSRLGGDADPPARPRPPRKHKKDKGARTAPLLLLSRVEDRVVRAARVHLQSATKELDARSVADAS
ncbi:hypothetical protein HPB47_005284 [Ixodes persulcatus]|uniref:Uncharacterized protein n=1 Tax=Ixodes persulcatus TaxID=34615 RepID=A0AC60PDD9_IXOPE|nr:hypothetical protein HPB47_005284 [Ixodes persulcatus]